MTVASGDRPTGTSTGAVSDYAPVAASGTRALSLDVDYLRTRTDMHASEVQELHDGTRELDLHDRALDKSKKSVASLLAELTRDRGMGWSDIAEVVGVSVSAIRKWRKGGEASPDSRRKLSRIAGFLDVLEEKALIADPARWMEMDLPLPAGYFVRPLDLYLEGHETALIDIAEGRQTVPQVLDQVRPNWRESRSDFEVVVDTDGERSIQHRDG